MSGSDGQFKPWSDNPNAPNISTHWYYEEKTWFAGHFLCSILYGTRTIRLPVRLFVLTSFVRFTAGTLIVLFFKCMIALFDPVHRKGERIKWGLVSYTVVMFSLATVLMATKGYILSISYIDNREFPGVEDETFPGPYGYQAAMTYTALSVVPRAAFRLNDWLADCLLVSPLFEAVAARPGT